MTETAAKNKVKEIPYGRDPVKGFEPIEFSESIPRGRDLLVTAESFNKWVEDSMIVPNDWPVVSNGSVSQVTGSGRLVADGELPLYVYRVRLPMWVKYTPMSPNRFMPNLEVGDARGDTINETLRMTFHNTTDSDRKRVSVVAWGDINRYG